MTSSESADLFARSWSLYDHITEHNYMFHQEIYDELAELLKQRHDAGQYRMLDLGCGNARYLVPALLKAMPAHYQGVDLSQVALDEAAGYLAELPSVTLTHGDLLQAVESTLDTWDVIFTGYALHHLPADDKARFFQAVARCLSPGGWLVMVDVVRQEEQSREHYLEGYLKFMRETWVKVPPEQLDEACAHVESYDFPESRSTLNEMAQASGLNHSRLISQYVQHHTLLFAGDELKY
jgi:SAM-dependent methyltransferase